MKSVVLFFALTLIVLYLLAGDDPALAPLWSGLRSVAHWILTRLQEVCVGLDRIVQSHERNSEARESPDPS